MSTYYRSLFWQVQAKSGQAYRKKVNNGEELTSGDDLNDVVPGHYGTNPSFRLYLSKLWLNEKYGKWNQ